MTHSDHRNFQPSHIICCFAAEIPLLPMGDCLVKAVGLIGSEDPADSAFWEYKG